MQVHTALKFLLLYTTFQKSHAECCSFNGDSNFLKEWCLRTKFALREKKNYLKGKMKMSGLAQGNPKIFSIIRRDLCSISLFYVLYSIEQVPL